MPKAFKKHTVRLTEKEYRHLKKQSELSGLKMEPFIRSLIMGEEIRPRPPTEYAALLRELSAIGNNFNQLVRVVNSTRDVTPAQINECDFLFGEIWRLVKAKL